ncbi:MAG: hypothetical protein ABR585_10950 [Gemmatimonadaceae bacterium]
MRVITIGGLTVALALACAPPATTPKRVARNPNVITQEEIVAANVYTVYDAVRVLRPNFLHSRGRNSMVLAETGLPRIYLDHQFYGEVESLRRLDVKNVREIHYYNSSDAGAKFGLGNTAGVIEVITGSD